MTSILRFHRGGHVLPLLLTRRPMHLIRKVKFTSMVKSDSDSAKKAKAMWEEQIGFGTRIKTSLEQARKEIKRELSPGGKGYVVLRPFIGRKLCQNMRSEAVALFKSGQFYKSFSLRGEEVIHKHNVYAMELDGHEWEEAPSLLTYTRDMMLSAPILLNSLFPSVHISNRAYATKLAVSTGGGSKYPVHIDNVGLPDTRKCTMVYYLNPNWKEVNGGELRIFTKPNSYEEYVDIQPEADTLLVFWSDVLEHEVLPCYDENEEAHRYTLTLWFVTEDDDNIAKQQS